MAARDGVERRRERVAGVHTQHELDAFELSSGSCGPAVRLTWLTGHA